jgi:hypothetical protein
MFNTELARRALKEIEARPKEWNQDAWRCRTGMCFAGFVAHAAGARWASRDWDELDVITSQGSREYVSEFAAQQLGFDGSESAGARQLFSAYNDLDDLKELVDEYAERNSEE